jgi:hypothetical protein
MRIMNKLPPLRGIMPDDELWLTKKRRGVCGRGGQGKRVPDAAC